MRSTRRHALIGLVAAAAVAMLTTASDSSAASGPQTRAGAPDSECRAWPDHADVDRSAAAVPPAAPVAARHPTASVTASIGYVSFGPDLHPLDRPRSGHLLRVRLDVLAAPNARDPDLRLDVDGARLVGCPGRDLVPGRVAHLLLTVRLPRSGDGSWIRVTATVTLHAPAHSAVLVFQKIYRLRVR